MRRQITLTTFLFLSRFSFLRYRILIFLFERFYISTISAVLISRVGACAWQGGIILSQTRSVSRISTRCSVWSQNKSVRNQSSSTLMTYSSSQVCIYNPQCRVKCVRYPSVFHLHATSGFWFYSYSAGGRTICQQLYCKGPLKKWKFRSIGISCCSCYILN